MNNMQNLSSKEIFSFGFKNAKKHFWSFFLFFIVYSIVSIIPVLNFFGIIYLMMSFYSAVLKISREEPVELKTFFTWPTNGFKALWAYIVSGLALIPVMLIMYLPLILIVMPGMDNGNTTLLVLGWTIAGLGFLASIYMSIRLYFGMFYSLETGSWAIASVKKSWEITENKVGKIIVLMIISVGVILLGVLAIFVGLLWAMPTAIIAYVYIYVKLLPKAEAVNQVESTVVMAQPAEIPAHTSPEMVESNTNI